MLCTLEGLCGDPGAGPHARHTSSTLMPHPMLVSLAFISVLAKRPVRVHVPTRCDHIAAAPFVSTLRTQRGHTATVVIPLWSCTRATVRTHRGQKATVLIPLWSCIRATSNPKQNVFLASGFRCAFILHQRVCVCVSRTPQLACSAPPWQQWSGDVGFGISWVWTQPQVATGGGQPPDPDPDRHRLQHLGKN